MAHYQLKQELQTFRAIILDLLKEGVVVPTIFSITSAVWPTLKPGKKE